MRNTRSGATRATSIAASCVAALLVAFVTACTTAPSPAPPTSGPAVPTSAPPSPSGAPLASILESFVAPATGFAFDAESVLGYYASQGFSCGEWAPSSQAAGYLYQRCERVDDDGRTRSIGVVTDPDGDLADGFASLTARPGETILDPAAALEPLAGFLGAMVGEERGRALVPWLAAHIGDTYAETTAADLIVATYTRTPDDHATLVVEVGNEAYLASPRPSSAAESP